MELISGYGTAYNPWPVLERLGSDKQAALEELWENLYHQGDIGSASYAAVPKLVALGELSLVAAIEIARLSEHNPPIPKELESSYWDALHAALNSNPSDEEQFQGYYAIHASLNGQQNLAKALHLLSVEEVLTEYG